MRGQEGDRVDVRTVRRARADLEVQVRAGGVAGGTGEAELLTGAHGLTRGDGDGGQVAVLRVVAVGVLDDDLVAVRAAPVAVTTVPEVMDLTPVPVATGKSMPVWLPLDQLEPEAR